MTYWVDIVSIHKVVDWTHPRTYFSENREELEAMATGRFKFDAIRIRILSCTYEPPLQINSESE